jgi:hypothetical protein
MLNCWKILVAESSVFNFVLLSTKSQNYSFECLYNLQKYCVKCISCVVVRKVLKDYRCKLQKRLIIKTMLCVTYALQNNVVILQV